MMDAIERQKLEELDGSRRPGFKGRAAVRRDDLAAIVSLRPFTAKKAAGATVTVAEYNALVADLGALRQALDQIAGRIK